MDTVRLHCQNGNHEWDRPRVRGKRPTSCPEHSTSYVAPTVAAITVERVETDDQVIAALAGITSLSERVCAAIDKAGLRVPYRDKVDRGGWPTTAHANAVAAIGSDTALPEFDTDNI